MIVIKNNIKIRNVVRSRNIRTMNSVKTILPRKFFYQMYYFSRNLEHVIFDEPNPCSKTKFDNIESFLNNLTIPIETYLQQYMPELNEVGYDERYLESWSKIANELESLKRSTNVPLMFDFIKLNTLD